MSDLIVKFSKEIIVPVLSLSHGTLIVMLILWAPLLVASQTLSDSQRSIASQDEIAAPNQAAPKLEARSELSSSSERARVSEDDFGEQRIVQRRAQVEPWSAAIDAQFSHTNNVAMTPSNEQHDWYFRFGAAIAYTNRIKGPLFVDISLQQHLFRYSEFDLLDFDLTRFHAGVLLQVSQLADTFLFTRYHLQRITEPGVGTAVFTKHSAEVGMQKVWKISRGQQVFAGLSADLSLNTDPSSSERDEYGGVLGYAVRLTHSVAASLSYRGARYVYRQSERADWNQILSIGVTYDLTDWLRLGANANYSHNDSNTGFADYENFIPGCSVALRASF